MRSVCMLCGAVVLAVFSSVASRAPQTEAKPQISDEEYIKQALSAAPEGVAKNATVARLGADGNMRVLRKGTNDFVCIVMGTDKMCNDSNAREIAHAMINQQPPPEKLGISYMLAGDEGGSNTDPMAEQKTADNHWVVDGPHLMVMGPAAKTLAYPRGKDADPSQPYMMWVGTPYEHAMIPVK